MEYNHRLLQQDELLDLLPQLLAEKAAVPLVITGDSMYPFLKHGRDTVYLQAVQRPLKKGNIVLYRRKNGQYVLHRILLADNTLTLLGDNQRVPEPGIEPEQVLAVVSAVRRQEKLLQPGDPVWNFYEKVWLCLIPLRPYLMAIHRRLFGKKPADLE